METTKSKLSFLSYLIEVWGRYAMFTQPGCKTERFSYPVMTPSAGRGILDSIYCKPSKLYWQIMAIHVLSKIRTMSVVSNEIKTRAFRTPIDCQAQRTQRQSVLLTGMPGTGDKGVHYAIEARVVLRGDQNITAIDQQIRRRIETGQCFRHPYFGCRDFPVFFKFADPDTPKPIPIDMDIGIMCYDCFDLRKVERHNASRFVSVFNASVRNGVMRVPDFLSEEVLKPC